MQNLFASASARSEAAGELLPLFARLLALQNLPACPRAAPPAKPKRAPGQAAPHPAPRRKRGFYWRAWSLHLTLWYLLWQRLSPLHTLGAVVADALSGGRTPLSQKLRSNATAGFTKARQRLPLPWLIQSFEHQAQALADLAAPPPPPAALPVRLLDGSTQRLRPHGDIPKHFLPHRT